MEYLIFMKFKDGLANARKYHAAHRSYLDKHFANHTFMASGTGEMQSGGLLCVAENREQVNRIIKDDPYCENGVASYDVMELNIQRKNE